VRRVSGAWRARWLAAALALSVVAAPAAQTPQTPAFRAATDTVEVEVSVFDKHGEPVTDLTSKDFEILEDGAPQRLQALYLASLDRSTLTSKAPAPMFGGPLPADVPPRRELKQRVFVFVLDMSHLSADGFVRTKAALESFLTDGLTAADVVGIVANGTMLDDKLQSDKQAALAALAKVGTPNLSRYNEMRTFPRLIDEQEATRIALGDARVTDEAVQRGCRERPSECRGPAGDESVRIEVEGKARAIAAEAARDAQATLASLQTLGTGLGKFPGPKQVVLFSEGFYVDEFREWLEHIVGLAARNNVRFSTIDARGLGRDPRTQNVFGEQPLVGPSDLTVMGLDSNADVLTSLALDTGGERVLNRNNLRPALDIIARETSSYYVLGYSPARPFDGSYRRIAVRVARPGVTVRARRGYVASEPAAPRADVLPPAAGTPAGSGAPTVEPALPATPETATDMLGRRPGSADRIETLVNAAPAEAGGNPEANRLALEGWRLYGQGDVDGARSRLAAAVAAGRAAPWTYYALGQAEFALRHFDAAVKAWETVRSALPDYEPVYFDLADGFLSLSRSSDALEVLRDASRRWPKDTEAHNALGVVLVKRGALDDAIGAFQKAVAADPSDGLGYFNLGRAFHLRYLKVLRSGSSMSAGARMLADRDRQKAVESYRHYLEIGGPFEADARQALDLLQWK